MKRFAASLLLLLALLPVQAQADIPDFYRGREIVAVEVAGESADIVDASSLQLPAGTRLTRPVVRELLGKLLQSDRWVDAQVDALPGEGGVILRLQLRPRVSVSRVEIRGNDVLDEATLSDALRLGADSTISDEDLSAAAARVRRAYAERGYLSTTVSISFRATPDPLRKVLMVDIVEGAPTRVARVRFSQEPPPYPPKVLRAMDLDTGDLLDRAALEEAAQAGALFLREQGYLEAEIQAPIVTVAADRAIIDLRTKLGPRYELRIGGFEPLTHAEVVEALDLHASPLTKVDREETIPARVRDLYARHGMPDAQVRVRKLRGKRPDTAVLEIMIKPGEPLTIVNVEFPGAHLLDQELLRDQVYSYLDEDLPGSSLTQTVDSEVADSVITGRPTEPRLLRRPLHNTPRQTFYPSSYRDAIEHIENLGRGQGFLSISAGPASIRRIEGRPGEAVVEIPVREGPRTRLHAVTLRGAVVMSPRDLLVTSGLKRNAPFSYVGLEEARLRILTAYRERGYHFARVEPQVRLSGDLTRADVLIEVVERFPVHIGQVVVRGAERTSESYIREVVELAPGDLYRPSTAQHGEESLQALGVFSSVNVGLQDPDLPARVKTLVVEVTERRNQYLDFTSGISSGQGMRGGFEYGYRNLFGQAIGLAMRVQLAYQLFFVDKELERRFKELTALNQRIERRISLGISIPRTPLFEGVKTAIDLVHLRDNERDFGIESNGLGVTFTYQPLRKVTTVFGVDLENNNVDLFVNERLDQYLEQTTDPRLRRLLRVPDGDTTLVAFRSTLSLDQRDSPFTPTRGFFLSLAPEVARTLSSELVDGQRFQSSFLKLSLTASGYLPVSKGVVLAGQFRIGRIFHFTDASQTYPNRAFFLGGVDTVRGYFQDAMMPQDLADNINPDISPRGVVRSGDAFALMRGELRFPLYGDLRGGLFLDMGNLWKDPTLLNPFDLRPSVGAGLRLSTPVGPIALDYGILVLRRRYLDEPFGALHFSIGLF